MIIFCFYSFFFINLKSFFFLSYNSFLTSEIIFILCVVPASIITCLFIDKNFLPSFVRLKEWLLYMFFFFFVFFFFCMMSISFSPFYFLFWLEFGLIPIFILILYFSKDLDKIYSGLLIVFFNVFGSLPFIYFSIIVMDYIRFFSSIDSLRCFCRRVVLLFGSLILVFKLPLFLGHFWLTKAHVSAFGCCSIVLASLLLKIGVLGLLKYYPYSVFKTDLLFFGFSFCLLGMLIFCLIMLRFVDIKYLIACSSVVHMSLLWPFCIELGFNSALGVVLIRVSHGVISYYLFFLVSLVYELSLSRSFDLNKSLSSLSDVARFFFFFFLMLNVGFPPFGGFFSEFNFMRVLFSFSSLFLILFFFSSFIFILFNIFLGCKFFFFKNLSARFLLNTNFFSSFTYYFFFNIFFVYFICHYSLI